MDGLNVYLYVGNNPINFYDPEGLEVEFKKRNEKVSDEDYQKVVDTWAKAETRTRPDTDELTAGARRLKDIRDNPDRKVTVWVGVTPKRSTGETEPAGGTEKGWAAASQEGFDADIHIDPNKEGTKIDGMISTLEGTVVHEGSHAYEMNHGLFPKSSVIDRRPSNREWLQKVEAPAVSIANEHDWAVGGGNQRRRYDEITKGILTYRNVKGIREAVYDRDLARQTKLRAPAWYLYQTKKYPEAIEPAPLRPVPPVL